MSIDFVPENKNMFSPGEVATMLRVSRRTILRWIEEGRLSVFRIAATVRIQRSDLLAFLDQHHHGIVPEQVPDAAP